MKYIPGIRTSSCPVSLFWKMEVSRRAQFNGIIFPNLYCIFVNRYPVHGPRDISSLLVGELRHRFDKVKCVGSQMLLGLNGK